MVAKMAAAPKNAITRRIGTAGGISWVNEMWDSPIRRWTWESMPALSMAIARGSRASTVLWLWVSSETIKTAAGEGILYWNVWLSNSACWNPVPIPHK